MPSSRSTGAFFPALSFALVVLGAGAGGLGACAAPYAPMPGEGAENTEDELRTSYGDFLDTLSGPDVDRWISARAALAAGFDRICGDTICSGDYSNLSTVRIACSSTAKALKMKDCVWVLGGSIDQVNGRTGKIVTDARMFSCKIPVARTADSLLDALEAAGDDALNAPIPGTGKSFYDGLVECFDGVVGPPPVAENATFWAELADWSWEVGETEALAWDATRRKLAASFDEVCGDSFCEGEYPDITPLRFACSINRNTKRVSRCTWSFAAAELSVGSRGAIATRTTTKKCNVEIGAQATALFAALGGDDPLRAPLPGRTTSIYDALIGCL